MLKLARVVPVSLDVHDRASDALAGQAATAAESARNDGGNARISPRPREGGAPPARDAVHRSNACAASRRVLMLVTAQSANCWRRHRIAFPLG